MNNRMLRLIIGGLALIGGIASLLNPLSASIAAATLAGWTLLIVGVLQGWATWTAQGLRATTGAGLSAAAALFMGILLLFGPFGDGTILQLVLGLLLLVSGAAKLWSARRLRGDSLIGAVLIAGAVSALLGVVVLTGIPTFLAGNLGIVLGLELLASGVALIVLTLRAAPAAR